MWGEREKERERGERERYGEEELYFLEEVVNFEVLKWLKIRHLSLCGAPKNPLCQGVVSVQKTTI